MLVQQRDWPLAPRFSISLSLLQGLPTRPLLTELLTCLRHAIPDTASSQGPAHCAWGWGLWWDPSYQPALPPPSSHRRFSSIHLWSHFYTLSRLWWTRAGSTWMRTRRVKAGAGQDSAVSTVWKSSSTRPGGSRTQLPPLSAVEPVSTATRQGARDGACVGGSLRRSVSGPRGCRGRVCGSKWPETEWGS